MTLGEILFLCWDMDSAATSVRFTQHESKQPKHSLDDYDYCYDYYDYDYDYHYDYYYDYDYDYYYDYHYDYYYYDYYYEYDYDYYNVSEKKDDLTHQSFVSLPYEASTRASIQSVASGQYARSCTND